MPTLDEHPGSDLVKMFDPRVLEGRIRSNIKVEDGGCWSLTRQNKTTYSDLTWNGKTKKAHIVSYLVYVGDVPSGMVLDHTCRHKWCINPGHLDPVAQRTNLYRSPDFGANRMECRRGHAYTPENTYVTRSTGARSCKACRKLAMDRFRSNHAYA